MLQAVAAHGGEVLGVGRVCAGPAALDHRDAQLIEQLGDAQLVRHREVDAHALRAVTQRGVVDLERSHQRAPTVSNWRETSRSTALWMSPVPCAPPRSGVRKSSLMQSSTACSITRARSSRCNEWRSSSAADRMAPYGLATPRPAMSGALPWMGSYNPAPLAPRLADGSMPSEPASTPASSLRM